MDLLVILLVCLFEQSSELCTYRPSLSLLKEKSRNKVDYLEK